MTTMRSPLRHAGLALRAVVFAGVALAGGLLILIHRRGLPEPESSQEYVMAHPLAKAGAAVLQGSARVVDGDTLQMGDRRVRLFGVDAPESAQDCLVDGSRAAIGSLAAHHLRSLADGHLLACYVLDQDRYGRYVAVCETDDRVELNFAMVRDGWARAFTRYAPSYVAVENRAQIAGHGIWRCSGGAIAPWDWRRSHRRAG